MVVRGHQFKSAEKKQMMMIRIFVDMVNSIN